MAKKPPPQSHPLSLTTLPLFSKSYSNEERARIVQDTDHHTGCVNVVALTGLQHVNNQIELVNGKPVPIHQLLLAIPTVDTSTGKLFIQVERQTGSKWLMCCFHSTDPPRLL